MVPEPTKKRSKMHRLLKITFGVHFESISAPFWARFGAFWLPLAVPGPSGGLRGGLRSDVKVQKPHEFTWFSHFGIRVQKTLVLQMEMKLYFREILDLRSVCIGKSNVSVPWAPPLIISAGWLEGKLEGRIASLLELAS